MLRQQGERTLAGGRGDGRTDSTLLAAHMLWAPTPDVTVRAAIGAGHARFDGARAVAGDGLGLGGRLRQRATLLSLDAGAEWALPVGPAWLNPSLAGGLSLRRADAGAGREAGAGGLSLLIDEAAYRRSEATLGFRIAPSVPLDLGGFGAMRLSATLDATLAHRFGGAAERARARFADMPELAFDLAGLAGPRDRIDLTAGVALQAEGGTELRLGYAARRLAGAPARDLRATLTVPF